MIHYPYLIIGGGITAAAAVRGIRKVDTKGKIGIISREPHPPYKRPFLSKALWKDVPYDKVWIRFDTKHVEMHLSTSVTRIDRNKKIVMDDRGGTYAYDQLLLATGGETRRLPWPVEGLIYFRDLDDYLKLRALTEHGQRFTVIGSGFIGSEIAAALAMNDKKVSMIFPEDGIGARIFPEGLSRFLNDYYRSRGVKVLVGETVDSIARHGDAYEIKSRSGNVLEVDGVIAGVGIRCNVELAQSAGLETDNGILVDEFLRTDDAAVYAAGDAANFYNPALGRRMRVEHEDNANVMGETAGRNMAGEAVPYHHLPFFYSDMFDLGYEAVGVLDAGMETVEDWREEYRQGVVYYLDEGRIRGILLWNTWGHMDAARALITEQGPFDTRNLKGRIR